MAYFARCYLDLETVNLTDPLISPLFGDFQGLPPLQLIVSRWEMCYDDSLRIADRARDAGVHVRLEEWDDMIHDFPPFGIAAEWPEVGQALEKMAGFVAEMTGE